MAGLGEAAWTAPEDALGRDVFDRLPRGPGSGAVRRLLNEIQMVLHDHPVNRARVSRGLAPVNSVWPWGWATGAAVPPLRWRGCVYGDHPYARGLARLAGARAEPAGAPPPADTAPVLKVCDGPLDRLLAGDEAGAASALADFDAAWCQPLLQALRRGRIEALRILAGHRCYALRPAAAWRIWRRLPAAEGGA
jgi:hypothetical protein